MIGSVLAATCSLPRNGPSTHGGHRAWERREAHQAGWGHPIGRVPRHCNASPISGERPSAGWLGGGVLTRRVSIGRRCAQGHRSTTDSLAGPRVAAILPGGRMAPRESYGDRELSIRPKGRMPGPDAHTSHHRAEVRRPDSVAGVACRSDVRSTIAAARRGCDWPIDRGCHGL